MKYYNQDFDRILYPVFYAFSWKLNISVWKITAQTLFFLPSLVIYNWHITLEVNIVLLFKGWLGFRRQNRGQANRIREVSERGCPEVELPPVLKEPQDVLPGFVRGRHEAAGACRMCTSTLNSALEAQGSNRKWLTGGLSKEHSGRDKPV